MITKTEPQDIILILMVATCQPVPLFDLNSILIMFIRIYTRDFQKNFIKHQMGPPVTLIQTTSQQCDKAAANQRRHLTGN